MQSLLIRIAKRLNKMWQRKGRVFSDRFFEHALKVPREARNALLYVLNNARKHGAWNGWNGPDPYSSGRWYDGWSDFVEDTRDAMRRPVSKAVTWLLTTGPLRFGPFSVASVPGP
jgi:hypothetical protein